jgi:hypothetical protein
MRFAGRYPETICVIDRPDTRRRRDPIWLRAAALVGRSSTHSAHGEKVDIGQFTLRMGQGRGHGYIAVCSPKACHSLNGEL